MLRLSLSRRPRDKRRANPNPRNPFPQFLEQRLNLPPCHAPPHPREDVVIDVLQRHVDVFHDARALRDRLDHLIREAARVGIHQPQPVDVLQLSIERAEQSGQPRRISDIRPIARRILPDEIQLHRPIRRQLLRLAEDLLHRLRSHQPPDARNRTKRTPLIAPLGNPQISIMPRRQPKPPLVILKHRQPIGFRFAHWRGRDCVR